MRRLPVGQRAVLARGNAGARKRTYDLAVSRPLSDFGRVLVGRTVGQIGIIVHDLESAARRYSTLWQNGPWRCFTYGPDMLTEQVYRNQHSRFSVRIAMNGTSPQIELLQPLEGPSIYHEWLDRHGEGLHHLAVFVDSLDDAIESMTRAGYGPIQLGRGIGVDGDGGFAYFDTERDFDLVLEAVEVPVRRREPELVIP